MKLLFLEVVRKKRINKSSLTFILFPVIGLMIIYKYLIFSRKQNYQENYHYNQQVKSMMIHIPWKFDAMNKIYFNDQKNTTSISSINHSRLELLFPLGLYR